MNEYFQKINQENQGKNEAAKGNRVSEGIENDSECFCNLPSSSQDCRPPSYLPACNGKENQADEITDTAEDTDNRYLFHDPRYLRMIDDIQTAFRNDFEFDNTISIADYIILLHKEMNAGQPGNYDMTPDPSDPQSESLIAQYALTLHAEEVSSYITSDWSEANILVRHNINSSNEIKAVAARAESRVAAILADVDPLLEFRITGENILINRAADSITSNQIAGFSILLATILIIMSLLFMNIKAGL